MTEQLREEIELLVLRYNENLATDEMEMTFDEMVDLLAINWEGKGRE